MICFLDYRITEEEINNINKYNLNPIIIPKTDLVYDAINGHVDIQINILDKESKKVIVHNSMSNAFLEELEHHNINYILSENSLGYEYPNNIILNSLILKDYFFHNIKYTDPSLLNAVSNKKIINVKQGYTKCSVLPLNDKAFITNDIGIAKKMNIENLDVLLLPYGDIELPNLNYGFIGGIGGMINNETLALFGDISCYQYKDEVINFTKKYGIDIISLKKGKLVDRGSLLVI